MLGQTFQQKSALVSINCILTQSFFFEERLVCTARLLPRSYTETCLASVLYLSSCVLDFVAQCTWRLRPQGHKNTSGNFMSYLFDFEVFLLRTSL